MTTEKFGKRKWTGWLTAGVVLAALLIAGPVFADGEEIPGEAPAAAEPQAEAPPLVDAPAEDAPEAAPTQDAELPDGGESDAEAPAPAAEETAGEEPAGDTAVDETGEATAAEDLPADGEAAQEPAVETAPEPEPVELVDASGEALDMASQASADLVSTGDPYWKVGSTKYAVVFPAGTPGDNCPSDTIFGSTCWESATPISFALDKIDQPGMLPSNRMLYVKAGTYTEPVTIEGVGHTNWALLNGLIGEDGSAVTFIDGDINITGNTGGFTLQGFTLGGGGELHVAGGSGTFNLKDVKVSGSDSVTAAINVNQTGAIVVDGVDASGNNTNGASFVNTNGRYPITVTNSVFADNTGSAPVAGLSLASNSKITLDGVVASRNDGDGVDIQYHGSALIKNSYFFFNNDTFGNPDHGFALWTYTDTSSTVTLENVYAGNNDIGIYVVGGSLRAAYVDSSHNTEDFGLFFYSASGSARIEYSEFNDNALDGLHIEHSNTIFLNSVRAGDNGGAGAWLDAGSTVTITSPTSGGWQQENSFYRNGLDGLSIFSSGNVSLTNWGSGENSSLGLFVDNRAGTGSVTSTSTLKNWRSGVSGNGADGICILSNGTVSLTKTGAWNNAGIGVSIETLGNIYLTEVTGSYNTSFGALLDNASAAPPRPIYLTNTRFDGNDGYGIFAVSQGAITAKSLSASGNSIRDIHLGQSALVAVSIEDLIYEDWLIDTYRFTANAGETVTVDLDSIDFNVFLELWHTDSDTLLTTAGGMVPHAELVNYLLTAGGNYEVRVQSFNYDGKGRYVFALNDSGHTSWQTPDSDGAVLNNAMGNAPVTVSYSSSKDDNFNRGLNVFENNMGNGLWVNSNGAISVTNAVAAYNYSDGIHLENPTSSGAVTVQFTSRWDEWQGKINENGGDGLYVQTRGNITLKNVAADNNGGLGANLDNCLESSGVCNGFGGIYVLADSNVYNSFSYNSGSNGLRAYSNGAIKLVNAQCSGNPGGSGALLKNEYDSASGYVNVYTSGRYSWNIFGEENDGNGGNGGNGLEIYSNGNISVRNASFYDNDGSGGWITNSLSPVLRTLTLYNVHASENTNYGVIAGSRGNITYQYGGAYHNGYYGAYLINSGEVGNGNVTVRGSSRESMYFDDNGWDTGGFGLNIETRGTVALSYLNAHNNSLTGVRVFDFYDALNPKAVSITEAYIGDNGGHGLDVTTYGSITIKGIDSSWNHGGDGARLKNHEGSAPVTITTSGGIPANNFNGNSSSGLTIESAGAVSITNTGASDNNGSGIYIINAYGTEPVTFTTNNGYYYLNNNSGGKGLYIDSRGNVTVNNRYGLEASYNGSQGVFINTSFGAGKYVKLYRLSTINNATADGLYVNASGYIYAHSLTANENGGNGAYLNAESGNITVTGKNYFNGNGSNGLEAHGYARIYLSSIDARDNAVSGLYAETAGDTISLSYATLRNNNYSGAMLEAANGSFTIYKVLGFANGWGVMPSEPENDGLTILAGAGSNVSIRYSSFQANGGSGIDISHPLVAFWPYLYKTTYLGNQGEDLYVH